eukprot:g40548.t1
MDDPSQPPTVLPSITDTSFQPIRFTPHDIKKRLEVLDTAKSMDLDNILAIVQICIPELAAPLAKLFQYSYNTGIYLTMCKIAQHLLSNIQFEFCQSHSAPDLITALVQTRTNELNSRGGDSDSPSHQGHIRT